MSPGTTTSCWATGTGENDSADYEDDSDGGGRRNDSWRDGSRNDSADMPEPEPGARSDRRGAGADVAWTMVARCARAAAAAICDAGVQASRMPARRCGRSSMRSAGCEPPRSTGQR